MTTKTIKTILFASLLVAMVLPFSGMMMAEAAPNENANKNTKKTHLEHIAEGKVVFPGGHYVDRSEVKGLDSAKSIEENAANGIDPSILTTHNGKTIFNLDAYKKKLQASEESDEVTNYPADGYNTIALKHEVDSMVYFDGYWAVPDKPATYDGEATIYIFNGMQPFPGVIMQPILQYGNNGICGNVGETWVMAPVIFFDEFNYSVGNCTTVKTGNMIKGTIGGSGTVWTVEILNLDIPGSKDSVQVLYTERADTSLVALETYGLPEDCKSLPGNIGFLQMTVGGVDVPNWADGSDPNLQWCDMEANIISETAIMLINHVG